MVEEVLDCVEEWKRREKAFEAGTQKYIASSVVDSFVYRANGLSVVGEDVSLRDERLSPCNTKQIPSLKTNEDALWEHCWPLWSQSQVCTMNRLAIGALP